MAIFLGTPVCDTASAGRGGEGPCQHSSEKRPRAPPRARAPPGPPPAPRSGARGCRCRRLAWRMGPLPREATYPSAAWGKPRTPPQRAALGAFRVGLRVGGVPRWEGCGMAGAGAARGEAARRGARRTRGRRAGSGPRPPDAAAGRGGSNGAAAATQPQLRERAHRPPQGAGHAPRFDRPRHPRQVKGPAEVSHGVARAAQTLQWRLPRSPRAHAAPAARQIRVKIPWRAEVLARSRHATAGAASRDAATRR
jgi:hypothetical protein